MKYVLQITLAIIFGFLLNLLTFVYVAFFGLPDTPYAPLILGALYEESLKLLLFAGLYKLRFHPYSIAFVAIGYGFFEQFVHITFVSSASLPTFWMHVSTGVVMAYMLKKTMDLKSKKYALSTFFLPFLIHFGYNGILMIHLWLFLNF